MKGIVLAGGAGSRLFPMTQVVSKQLQPVYDKPMIYYPLSLLMLSGINDILIISTPQDIGNFEKLLGDGSRFGISLTYKIQDNPNGIAEAYIIAEEFLGGEDSALILGDNLFYGNFSTLRDAAKAQLKKEDGLNARVFAYAVNDPQRYGVVEFDRSKKVISIEEKPQTPKSNYAIPGLYFFDGTAVSRAKNLKPSARGELEITDLIKDYLKDDVLGVSVFSRGMAWFDTGTPQSLLEASAFIGAIEQRQGLKVACLEEIGLRMEFVSKDQFNKNVSEIPNSSYKEYLLSVANEF